MTYEDAQRRVHEAIGAMLDDGEFVMAWTLTIVVAGPDDRRYLAHRAGGGADGTDNPMVWTALGMIRSSMQVAEGQLRDCTEDRDDEEDDG